VSDFGGQAISYLPAIWCNTVPLPLLRIDVENPIRVRCEFDSNVIDESDSQDEKRPGPRISTLLGIKID
jgi:hypothetical protein